MIDGRDFVVVCLIIVCVVLGSCLCDIFTRYNIAKSTYCASTFDSNVVKFQRCMKLDLTQAIKENR